MFRPLKKNNQAGNADVAFFVGFFLVLFLLWWAGGGTIKLGSGDGAEKESGAKKSLFKSSSFSGPSAASSKNKDSQTSEAESYQTSFNQYGEPYSPWRGQITIDSLGTAKSATLATDEYLVIEANNKNQQPINITGWFLTNNRSRHSGQARIPVGKLLYVEDGINILQAIILEPGAKAVVVTGVPPFIRDFQVESSFKVNICSGYVERLTENNFRPKLAEQCPNPENEAGVEYLDEDCFEFVEGIGRCHTPEFEDYLTIRGERERGKFVDGVEGLSSNCRAFLESRYSYEGCVNYHLNDHNFYQKEWRVYLYKNWEMWAKTREVVTLYDDYGRVVDQKSY